MIVLLIAAVGLGYGLYPYVALYQLKSAMHDGDPVSLSQMIDWSSVREGIKEDLCDLVLDTPGEPIGRDVLPPFGASFIRGVTGSAVDRTVNPETLVAATREPSDATPSSYEGARVSWAFFSGPGSFRIDVETPGVAIPIRVDMELRGLQWLVRRVSLPPALLESSHLHT